MSNNPRAPASRTADTSKTTVTPRFTPHIKFHIRAAPVRRHPRSTVPRPFRRRSARSPTNHPAKRIPRQKPRHIALRSRAASGAAYFVRPRNSRATDGFWRVLRADALFVPIDSTRFRTQSFSRAAFQQVGIFVIAFWHICTDDPPHLFR